MTTVSEVCPSLQGRMREIGRVLAMVSVWGTVWVVVVCAWWKKGKGGKGVQSSL
jgi:hypothetical protein